MTVECNIKKRYVFSEETGKSTDYSSVFEGQDVLLGRKVAIKRIEYKKAKNGQQMAENEVKALAKAGDVTNSVPCIIDTWKDETFFYIVMQWLDGETLKDKQGIPDRRFLDFMINLTDVLIRLQGERLTHRDIKPENIIITRENRLYLIDFNISLSMPNLNEGTPLYRAPEMYEGNNSTDRRKVDVWGIGMLLYHHCTGKGLVYGRDYGKDFWEEGRKWSFLELDESINKKWANLITKCLEYDPLRRIDLRALKKGLIDLK